MHGALRSPWAEHIPAALASPPPGDRLDTRGSIDAAGVAGLLISPARRP